MKPDLNTVSNEIAGISASLTGLSNCYAEGSGLRLSDSQLAKALYSIALHLERIDADISEIIKTGVSGQ